MISRVFWCMLSPVCEPCLITSVCAAINVRYSSKRIMFALCQGKCCPGGRCDEACGSTVNQGVDEMRVAANVKFLFPQLGRDCPIIGSINAVLHQKLTCDVSFSSVRSILQRGTAPAHLITNGLGMWYHQTGSTWLLCWQLSVRLARLEGLGV